MVVAFVAVNSLQRRVSVDVFSMTVCAGLETDTPFGGMSWKGLVGDDDFLEHFDNG